ncbi:PQQ-dependent dehydrogenase, methanol/ethanol family [Sphingobium chlorophenolicum]|uniref:Alcohol dehydrogenase (Acceptor) n=1 Tax=Sphingobium chlorophenolicum TaxID=46429 RepID=A0A081RAR4_SPHCR|nr:PQQ-dependent dehydrogenase, methanol/ethanol family [Sphingobium chlorophenolicum]KEQ52287.1 Alcohol dehydrogenase (Acceptor) precursor [Sphingobium chlorophenolicum]
MKARFSALAAGAALLALSTGVISRSAQSAGPAATNWSSFGGDDQEQHYSPLAQIGEANVAKLGLAWSYDVDSFDSYTQPLAVDGVIYFAVGLSVVHAVDARTGKLLWQYDPDVASQPEAQWRMRAGWGTRGIAYKDGMVFTATREGRLIAVDAKTGKPRWSVKTLDEAEGAYITGPPWIAGDKVVIGFGGADYSPTRGYVTAYDIKTGKKAWRWYVVPGDPAKGFENKAMEAAAKTWTGEWWKWGGGGSVWHAMAYDAKYDRLYIGTGNGFPWNIKIRSPGGGDNLYLSSIVALDVKTGEYVWHYQVNPENSHDWNDAMDIELADIVIGGRKRSVLMHAPKNGFFYAIDRETGKFIQAGEFAKQNWAKRIDPVTGRPEINPEAQYPDGKPFMLYPFPNGAHGIQAMSFSPKTGYSYIPVMEGGRVFVDPANIKDWQYKPGMMVNTGLGAPPANLVPPAAVSKLVAYDVANNRIAWSVPQPGVFNGGTLATAGNLVFQGTNDGMFNAFSATTGRKLWSWSAQNGILSAPISYSVGGKQYVSVITSFRSSFPNTPNWDYRQQQRRLLTFTIGGAKKLPKVGPVDEPIQDDPAFVVDAGKAKVGAGIYNSSCVICHGAGMMAGGAAPDLRKSGVPLDAETFRAVVHDGALMARGMGSFSQLTDAELEGLRHYIRQRARETAPKGK